MKITMIVDTEFNCFFRMVWCPLFNSITMAPMKCTTLTIGCLSKKIVTIELPDMPMCLKNTSILMWKLLFKSMDFQNGNKYKYFLTT